MRLGITAKLLIPLALMYSLLTFVATQQVLNLFLDKQTEIVRGYALSMADSVAMLFDKDLDKDLLERVVNTIALDEQVVQAVIVKPETDQILASSRYRYAKHSLDDLPDVLVTTYQQTKSSALSVFSPVEDSFYALAYPINAVSENSNSYETFILLVYFDTYVAQNQYFAYRNQVALWACVFLLGLLLGSYFLLRRFVISPLRHFENTIRQQSNTGKVIPVHLSSRDEISDIATEFNRLRSIEDESLRAAQEATEAAKQLANKKAQFLANMSHELRTPINGIMGLAQLCLDTDSTQKQTTLLHQLQSSSRLLLSIVNDILDFSKAEEGRLVINREWIDLQHVVQEVVTFIQVLAENKGLELNIEFTPRCPASVCIDSQRIQQILINMLSNAVKFTQQGQVSLKLDFELSEDQPGYGMLSLRVTDSGIGIEEKCLPTLFEPFEQGDNSVTRAFGGTGLGLSITKQLVDLMDGAIRVTSTHGSGSEFSADIPCQSKEQRLQKENSTSVSTQQLTGSLLLVEDNEINALVATEMLENMGHNVVLAEHGEAALRQLSQQDFDLVLMDIQMPVMDGYRATQALRELGYTMPVIGLSANVLAEEEQKARDAGMDDYLHKPIEKQNLQDKVASYLAG